MSDKVLIHSYSEKDSGVLVHHGILGQKWGVRRGDSYPLSYDEHSAAEKQKNPKTKLDNYDDTSSIRTKRKSRNTKQNTNKNTSKEEKKQLEKEAAYVEDAVKRAANNVQNSNHGYDLNPYERQWVLEETGQASKSSKNQPGFIEKAINDAKRDLGFDKRKEYLDAREDQYIHNNPLVTDYGDIAQEHIDEIEEKYDEIGWDKMTDEDQMDLQWYTYFRDEKNEDNKAREAKTNALLKEYENTPIGKVETFFNDAVKTGESVVNSVSDWTNTAVSDVSNFFKNLF